MLLNDNPPAGQKRAFLIALFTLLTFSFSACKKEDTPATPVPTINELITGGNNFTLLKAALVRAGLDGALSQPGAYTVFAPSDNAFKLFGYADVNAINAAPVDLLKTVLQYHVLGTRIGASDVPAAVNTSQQTLAGLPVYISKIASASTGTSSTISINGARVLQADGQATNGVVHAIDRVLLPPVFGNVVQTIQGIPQLLPTASFKLLQAAVTKTGLASQLVGPGPITVFAPSDAAFKAVGIDSAAIVKTPVATLAAILSYHVLNSRTYTPTIANGSTLTTLQGGTVTAGVSTTALTVTGKGNGGTASNITGPDITTTNGVVHIIDRLLLPQ